MLSDAAISSKKSQFKIWVGIAIKGVLVLFLLVGIVYALEQGMPEDLIHILLKHQFPLDDILLEGAPGYSRTQLSQLDEVQKQGILRSISLLTGANIADAHTFFLSYFISSAQGSAWLGGAYNLQGTKQEVTLIPLPDNSSPISNKSDSVMQPSTNNQANSKHTKYTVVIDPGHGGADSGAQVPYVAVAQADISPDGNMLDEKTITLSVAQQLKRILNSQGINVIMTRSKDTTVSLSERANISNNSGANIFVCIHCNWVSDHSITGVLGTYFENGIAPYTNNVGDTIDPQAIENWPLSKDLASKIANSVAASTGQSVFGLQAQPYEVLRLNHLPSTLVELGFMTNPATAKAMETSEWQLHAATGIANGIISYFNSHSVSSNRLINK